jgi:putative oxidoreductase
VDLLVAIVTVHLPKGFFMDKGGYEFPLTLLGACLTILLAGAKTPSVDRRLPREI